MRHWKIPWKPKHCLARRNTESHIKLWSNPAGDEEPLSAVVPVLRYHGSVEMLPEVCLRLSSGSAHLEPPGQVWVWAPGGARLCSGQLHRRTSLFYLLLVLVWNLSGSCCLFMSNLGEQTWGVSLLLISSPRSFYAK